MRDKRHRQSANNTDHPRRKVRTENIDGGRLMTGHFCRHKKNNEDGETSEAESQNCSFRVHRGNGRTAAGLNGRAGGRAKSPALNASSVAALKIADCVSWLTLRADAKFRCALTISG